MMELFLKWREKQQQIGQKRVDAAFSWAAGHYNVHLFANPVNPVSYAHFLRDDVQSKSWRIRERTSREGVANGFIAAPGKALTFTIEGTLFYADQIADEPIQVLAYPDGRYVVSDIDLLMIASREEPGDVFKCPEFGEMTREDQKVIEGLNRYFHPSFNLVAHGPANCFSESKASHIHHPVTHYLPNGDKRLIPDFLSALHQVRRQGYHTPLNPRWNLCGEFYSFSHPALSL